MKIISISLLSIILSLSLFARPNPFEPTDQFLENKELLLKQQAEEEKIKLAKEKEEQLRIAQELEDKKKAKEMVELQEAQKIKEQQAQEIKDKELQLKKEEQALKKVESKPYIPTIKENFKVLPFVKIYVTNDILTIEVDPKYPLLNQDILKPEKKFLFDFRGNISFYTVRNIIVNEDFKSFAVGTHMEEKFFRVVIDLPEDMENYIEKIDSTKGIITIQKK